MLNFRFARRDFVMIFCLFFLFAAGWFGLDSRVSASGIQAFATVPAGGTARATLASGAVLYGLGTSPVGLVTNPADNTMALCGSNPPAFGATCTGGGGTPATFTYCAPVSASGTTYTCTPSPAVGSYTTGLTITFVPDVANTAAATVNVSALGAKSIKVANTTGSALVADDLLAGGVYSLEYDGTNFRKISGPDGAWTAVTFQNSWADNGGGNQTTQYRKDHLGNVSFRGLPQGGTQTVGTDVFTLPAGYRPPAVVSFNGIAGSGQVNSRFDVLTTGEVQVGVTIGAAGSYVVGLGGFWFSVY